MQHRSDEYAAGRQGEPIASWACWQGTEPRAPPIAMRSTIIDLLDGSQRTAVRPADVRHTVEDMFEGWFDGEHTIWAPKPDVTLCILGISQ